MYPLKKKRENTESVIVGFLAQLTYYWHPWADHGLASYNLLLGPSLSPLETQPSSRRRRRRRRGEEEVAMARRRVAALASQLLRRQLLMRRPPPRFLSSAAAAASGPLDRLRSPPFARTAARHGSPALSPWSRFGGQGLPLPSLFFFSIVEFFVRDVG